VTRSALTSNSGGRGRCFDARASVAGLDDLAMVVVIPVEQCLDHLVSPKTQGHSTKARLVVTMIEVCS
jgi:hypothetical protein